MEFKHTKHSVRIKKRKITTNDPNQDQGSYICTSDFFFNLDSRYHRMINKTFEECKSYFLNVAYSNFHTALDVVTSACLFQISDTNGSKGNQRASCLTAVA